MPSLILCGPKMRYCTWKQNTIHIKQLANLCSIYNLGGHFVRIRVLYLSQVKAFGDKGLHNEDGVLELGAAVSDAVCSAKKI